MRGIGASTLVSALIFLVGLTNVTGQVRLCNGVGRRYCAKAHLAPECPRTCLPEKCRGRRRVGYRRCANENWRTCYDYKWEQVANYGWYDLVYVDGSRLCLGTCREEPDAMRCLNNEYLWYKGRKYCQMSDCRRARMGVQSGCHQERDFHQPTCKECSVVFATACASLYTQEDLDDSRPGGAERNRRYRPYPDPPNPPVILPGIVPEPTKKDPLEPEPSKPEPVNPAQPATQQSEVVQLQPAEPAVPADNGATQNAQPDTAVPSEPALVDAADPAVVDDYDEQDYGAVDEDQDYEMVQDYEDQDYEMDLPALFSEDTPVTEVVEASVQLNIPPEKFDNDDAARLVSAISNVAGVSPQEVEVVSSGSTTSRRKLLEEAEESPLTKEPITTVNTIVMAQDLHDVRMRIEDADRTGSLKRECDAVGTPYLPFSLTSRIVVVPRGMLPSAKANDVLKTRVTVLAVGVSVAALIALLATILLAVRCSRKSKAAQEAPADPKAKPPSGKADAVAVEAVHLEGIPAQH